MPVRPNTVSVDDRAADQLAEQHAGDRERGQQRVARDMPPQHPRRGTRPWPRRRRRTAASCTSSMRAGEDLRERRRDRDREGEHRQDQRLRGVRPDDGHPAELEREDLDQHDAEPEHRHRDEERRAAPAAPWRSHANGASVEGERDGRRRGARRARNPRPASTSVAGRAAPMSSCTGRAVLRPSSRSRPAAKPSTVCRYCCNERHVGAVATRGCRRSAPARGPARGSRT